MRRSIEIAPSNSIIFVSDPEGGTIPQITRNSRLWSTPSCICIGCYPEQDGPTQIVLGQAQEVDPGGSPVFEGSLETPHRSVAVSTVEGDTILGSEVSGTRTRVRVWVNHPQCPDKVIIGLE